MKVVDGKGSVRVAKKIRVITIYLMVKHMTKIKLNNQLIGHGCQPFIIAEAGINHNGKIENALKMIDAAKAAGC